MNILSKVTWKAMWKNKTRTIVTIIGVIISAAMFMAVATTVCSLWDFMVRGYIYEVGDFFVNIEAATDKDCEAVRNEPSVDYMADYKVLGYYSVYNALEGAGENYMLGAVDEVFLEHMSVPLEEGRLPENSGEIVIPDFLNASRKAQNLPEIAVGEHFTLDIYSEVPTDEQSALTGMTRQTTFTVVGIMEQRDYTPNGVSSTYPSILTLSDGNEGETLWHRLFVKTYRADDASSLIATDYGEDRHTNPSLLRMYGFAGAANTNSMLMLLAMVLVIIIMVASVSLIGNAFSISVSERTKQFGLLSSIGATRKQIRQSVRFEALFISTMGIPVGVLCGYGGIAVVLHFLGDNLMNLFSFGADGAVEVYAVLSPVAMAVAAAVCLLTIFISSWVPSRRATSVTPLEAIRQSTEYKTQAKDVKVGKITGLLFGLPGLLAAKYHKISRRKYRATMISLAISLVLFTFSSYYSQQLTMTGDSANVENYDFLVVSIEDDYLDVYERLRADESVERSSLTACVTLRAAIPTDALADEYKEIRQATYGRDYIGDWTDEYMQLVFLEDRVFAEHLRGEGIDPQIYLESEELLAVSLKQNYGGYYYDEKSGAYTQKDFFGNALESVTAPLRMYDATAPEELLGENWSNYETILTESGEPLLVVYRLVYPDETELSADAPGFGTFQEVPEYYYMEITEDKSGAMTVCHYYTYDPERKVKGNEILATTECYAPLIRIGDALEQTPLGVSAESSYSITVVLPMSKLDEALITELCNIELSLKSRDYQTTLTMLAEHAENNLQFHFSDYAALQMESRGLITLIRVFSLGFIILISLISAANVFNTISTNIALRRRDFGMLRSVGMKTRELYRMMIYECLTCGAKALAWGLPISILTCYWLHRVINMRYLGGFQYPWGVALMGAGCIFLVVFASMLYAIGKLKKDNPIEAVRMENL